MSSNLHEWRVIAAQRSPADQSMITKYTNALLDSVSGNMPGARKSLRKMLPSNLFKTVRFTPDERAFLHSIGEGKSGSIQQAYEAAWKVDDLLQAIRVAAFQLDNAATDPGITQNLDELKAQIPEPNGNPRSQAPMVPTGNGKGSKRESTLATKFDKINDRQSRSVGLDVYVAKKIKTLAKKLDMLIARANVGYGEFPLSELMTRGAGFGSNLSCGPGMVPLFKAVGGDNLRAKDAIITGPGGKKYLSGMVDLDNSKCVPAVEVRAMSVPGARGARVPFSDATGTVAFSGQGKVPFNASAVLLAEREMYGSGKHASDKELFNALARMSAKTRSAAKKKAKPSSKAKPKKSQKKAKKSTSASASKAPKAPEKLSNTGEKYHGLTRDRTVWKTSRGNRMFINRSGKRVYITATQLKANEKRQMQKDSREKKNMGKAQRRDARLARVKKAPVASKKKKKKTKAKPAKKSGKKQAKSSKPKPKPKSKPKAQASGLQAVMRRSSRLAARK